MLEKDIQTQIDITLKTKAEKFLSELLKKLK